MSKMKESARKEAIEVLEASIRKDAQYYAPFEKYQITNPTIEDDKMTFDVVEAGANLDYTITADLKTGDYWDSEDLYDTDYPERIRQSLEYFSGLYNEFETPDNFDED